MNLHVTEMISNFIDAFRCIFISTNIHKHDLVTFNLDVIVINNRFNPIFYLSYEIFLHILQE